MNTDDDWARDDAIAGLHHEAVLERAAQEQAILLFVEGDSEEIAFPMLFTDALDSQKIGVKIANYNGHGNLAAFLKLLTVTLKHRHPIVVTYDNDPESGAAIEQCRSAGLISANTYLFKVPLTPVVKYSNEHTGGSFEEAFPCETFLDAAFCEEVLPKLLVDKREEFEAIFDRTKPWLAQLKRFCAPHGFTSLKKPVLAEALADRTDDLPETFARLIELLTTVRKDHPVSNPNDVKLPHVRGLTD